MKKLVFAAIAAMVMVSVSNVFASNKMASVSSVAPTEAPADTTVNSTEEKAAPAETPVETSVAADSTVAE